MRVISGKYKGKNLIGFNIDGTRPTMDRVKESLFGIIQNYIKDSIVLDLFAGSGSLGIEALSNGASSCYFFDNNIELVNIIKKKGGCIRIPLFVISQNQADQPGCTFVYDFGETAAKFGTHIFRCTDELGG